jgi:nucleotide-binding universal stress UspA family protein
MEKNILIAFDDSENSMRAVASVSNTFSNDHKVTIFSVVPDTMTVCNMYSPELTPLFKTQQGVFCAMDEKNRQILKEAQQRAKEVLEKKGFPSGNISMKIETAKKGVARDIIHEAQSGYSVVVLGRRGLSGIKEFFLGSVSQKVISLAKDISIFVVD